MIRICTLLFHLFLYFQALAQSPCLPEGITFTTQEQIDDFQSDYPGCSEIEGNVIIGGGNILNLDGLSILTAIYGDLCIGFDPLPTFLTSLSGLENLQSVGGSLSIYKNGSLTGIEALGNLSELGEDLLILQNEVLTSITGLEGIDSIPGNLIIRRNYQLGSLEPLQGLVHIGGDLRIMLNDNLVNLEGMEGITAVPGDVVLFGEQLASLDGLDNLKSIGDNLQIGDQDVFWNTQLEDLSALENLESIGSVLLIYWNQVLESLTGLDNINGNSIQHLEIIGNPALADCHVQSICDYLSSPNGTVFIAVNATGCNSIEEVEEACESVGTWEFSSISPVSVHAYKSGNFITFSMKNIRGPVSLSCFNHLGQMVFTERVMDGGITVNVSGWKTGLYLTAVYADGELLGRQKFILP